MSFTASPGEIVGITGANGQGKTTLARTLCGLKKEKSGEILFSGQKVNWKKRRNHAYLLMQDPNYQLFGDSVEGELGLTNVPEAIDETRIDKILKELSLDMVRTRHPLSLSGGQKQRVSIALAALSSAAVLIFDEPTSGLDYINMRAVVRMLKQLAGQGKTVLVISHDNELINLACSRVIALTTTEEEEE